MTAAVAVRPSWFSRDVQFSAWRRWPASSRALPTFGSWALWLLGYPEQAVQFGRKMLALAEASSRPASLANALNLTAILHMFLRDPLTAHEQAEAAVVIATEHGFPFELAYGTFARGWASCEQGRLLEGIAEMRWGSGALLATGFAVRPRSLAFLAEACAKCDGPAEGLKLLAEAMSLLDSTQEHVYEAEVHRLKGDLMLMQDGANATEEEQCFRTAIEVARGQNAKSLELRATTSLARLLAKQGRGEEARAMLADIYNWFTEGFDTADLKDAKALLDEPAG
jgi:predicted ATPase